MRYQVNLTREQRIPKDFVEKHRDDALGVLVMARPDGLVLQAYFGRSQKPSFYTKFHSEERANEHLAEWLKDIRRKIEEKAAWKAARSAPHRLNVGDVLYTSWGYDQTNVDFYQITALVGKRTVELREIKQGRGGAGSTAMGGTCFPLVGTFSGEPFRKMANAQGIILIGGRWSARPLDFEIVEGERVYKRVSYTNYC